MTQARMLVASPILAVSLAGRTYDRNDPELTLSGETWTLDLSGSQPLLMEIMTLPCKSSMLLAIP